MSYKLKTCVRCSSEFRPISGRQRFCDGCSEWRRGEAVCEVCGETFRRKPNTSGRWCSKVCFSSTISNPGCEPRPCPQCGKTFKPREARIVACSRACAGEMQRAEPRLRQCAVCDVVFDYRKHPTKRVCSPACRGVLRRKDAIEACERCGTEMPRGRNRHRRFCSAECRAAPLGALQPASAGYVRIKTDRGWLLQHRVVVEQQLGRHLEREERVHHRNGVRDDNRPENLELWLVLKKDPAGQRVDDLIDFLVAHYPDRVMRV